MRPEPLDPALRALYASEPLPEPPPGAEERVYQRVALSIGALDGRPRAAPAPARRRTTRLLLVAAAIFVAGAAAGATATRALTPEPPPRIVYLEAPKPSANHPLPRSVDEAPAVPLVPASALPDPGPTLAASRGMPPSPPAPPASDHPDGERSLLEQARASLAAGDSERALARLDDHAQRYPAARFTEEREALAIQALVQRGRFDDARQRAARFRERWPRSVYLSAVDATLQSIP